MLKTKPIYVEIPIQTTMERIWEYTQTPSIHQQWDLRFSSIEYLPKSSDDALQRFLYQTQIGFGIKVSGEGESVGTHSKETGESTSALKFWSEEKISLIKTGSGYWKYIPAEKGVIFLTRYDYETRHGFAGKLIDKLFFRPLIGRATAWSFDALRNWLEKGIAPSLSKKLFFILFIANFTIALTWIYHGVVPKLMHMETGELAMVTSTGMFAGMEREAVITLGIAEVIFGCIVLFFGRRKFIHWLNIAGLLALAAGAFIAKPEIYIHPFNPATTEFGVIGLSIIVLSIRKYVPYAGNCKRKPGRKNVDL